MPIELQQRLSEFSYGYGVTREIEIALAAQGLIPTPFMPSLIHEAKLGFDVAFERPGTPLLLQFKLGQAMQRFVPAPRPNLSKPYWRFHLNTAEPDGQFDLLLKAEQDGADVFYVAPQFHDWERYLRLFETQKVVQTSCIVRPSNIRDVLDANAIPHGWHKVVYDAQRAYVCSDPIPLEPLDSDEFAESIRYRCGHRKTPLREVLRDILEGFDRPSEYEAAYRDGERLDYEISSDKGDGPRLRNQRLTRLLQNWPKEQAIALAVGAEAWSMGAQVIFVTLE